MRMPQFSFFLASSHHINMNLCYIFLLLLVVLSAYSESPQYGKHSDSFDLPLAAVCPNNSSDNLGILAPVLPQNESGSVLSQNMVLPHDEVYRTDVPLHEFGSVLQNGVFKFVLPQNGCLKLSCLKLRLIKLFSIKVIL